MATATEYRRRNAYPAACCVCGDDVAADAGWLYLDQKAARRTLKRFPKKVKCDRCHRNNLAHNWQVKALDNPTPAVRRWSVTDVARWGLEIETEAVQVGTWKPNTEDPRGPGIWTYAPDFAVHVHVTVNGDRQRLAGKDLIDSSQAMPERWYELEWTGIGGRPFTPAAWERLAERVREAIKAARETREAAQRD